ncbi:MAG: hypothetical protein A3K04_12415 [Gallionellales bacterium RBG_16_56_9]|nr:MAG: hypothetical protein A3K04_12415 [Gallionellales bacterium RBG_16_56_9]
MSNETRPVVRVNPFAPEPLQEKGRSIEGMCSTGRYETGAQEYSPHSFFRLLSWRIENAMNAGACTGRNIVNFIRHVY